MPAIIDNLTPNLMYCTYWWYCCAKNLEGKLTVPKFAIQTTKPVFIILPVAIKIYTAVESFLKHLNHNHAWFRVNAKLFCFRNLNVSTRNGTGQDFLDPTGKFQNLRRLTGRSTGFFKEFFFTV